jgi:hypothetical protein
MTPRYLFSLRALSIFSPHPDAADVEVLHDVARFRVDQKQAVGAFEKANARPHRLLRSARGRTQFSLVGSTSGIYDDDSFEWRLVIRISEMKEVKRKAPALAQDFPWWLRGQDLNL